jgi:hypothetical protein
MTTRAVAESPVSQGVDEQIAYAITTTPWGSSPTSIVVVVKDWTDNRKDVTNTVTPTNSPSVDGDVITLSPLKSLTAGHTYQVEVQFTAGGSVFKTFCQVIAEA